MAMSVSSSTYVLVNEHIPIALCQGLVKYALMHGQPVNSVLNGVLPIHIAASSGNEHVVQMLIDAGADVNAAR